MSRNTRKKQERTDQQLAAQQFLKKADDTLQTVKDWAETLPSVKTPKGSASAQVTRVPNYGAAEVQAPVSSPRSKKGIGRLSFSSFFGSTRPVGRKDGVPGETRSLLSNSVSNYAVAQETRL